MRFIITAQASADKKATEQPPDFDVELFKAYMRFNEEMHQAGILVASEGLNPSAPGARVAVANGKRYVTDGPFTESKELVGGFYLIEVTSLDAVKKRATLKTTCTVAGKSVIDGEALVMPPSRG